MKQGWQTKTIGELFETGSGGTPLKMHNEYYEGGDIPWLRSGEVCKKYITETELFITQLGFENSSAKYFPTDTIVVAMYGATAGQVGILKFRTTTNQAVCGILPNTDFIPEFVYYVLLNKQKELVSQATGNAQPNISQIKIKNLPIPLLSLSEQQCIVALLDAEFAKIDAMKANAEKNLQNAKDLYNEVLKRELMPHKKWNSQTLDDVCTKIVDGTHNSPVNSSKGDYMYVTAKNIKTWGLDLSNITYVTSEIHREIYDRCNPEKGDVLYIKDGATTGIAIVNPISDEYSLLSSVALLKPKKDVISGAFLCYAMNSPMMYQFVREQMDGAAITRITLKKIKSFTISYPSLDEQNNIVARLDALNEKCKTLQANYEKTLSLCDDLKQALLRKAFNGEI